MMERHHQADDRPVAPTDDRGAADLQSVHHRQDVRGHQLIGVAPLVARAAAVAAAVDQHDATAGGEQGRDLVPPIAAVAEAAN